MQLTEQVRQRVVRDILDGIYIPGDRLPTERDMTAITGTSRVTVRRAYAQLEQAGIITRRPSAGTRVATSFTGNTEEMDKVAIISSLRDPFALDFIEAVNKLCQEDDILNILAVAGEGGSTEQSSAAVELASKGVKSIIVWGFDKRFDFKVFERLRVLGINLVFFDRVIPGPYADYVGLDNRHAIESLFSHAIERGMKDMLFIDMSGLEVDSNHERLQSAHALCSKASIAFESMLTPCLENPSAMPSFMNGLKERLKVFQEDIAIFCVNDTVAISIQPLVASLGHPFKIYSVDGTDSAKAAGITSYAQPIREMAAASVEALRRQRVKGDSWRARQYRFKGKIVEP